MFKAAIKGEIPLIMLGFSKTNVRELLKDNPIVFELNSLGLGEGSVCVTCARDGKVAVPKSLKNVKSIILAITEDTLEIIALGTYKEVSVDGYRFMLFAGEDEKTIAKQFKESIGPRTIARSEGFAPSDTFVSEN